MTIRFQMSAVVMLFAAGAGGIDCGGESMAEAKEAPLVRPEVAAEYKDKTAPWAGDAEKQKVAVEAAGARFTAVCMTCHGAEGKGDGEGGKALAVKPSDFTRQEVQQQSDAYLFWRISEGSSMAPFNTLQNKGPTAMIGYKDAIPEEERWNLVAKIRSFKK